MKIRTAFVSNSSSSSYMVAVPEYIHEEILDTLHEFKQHLLRGIFKRKKLFGSEFLYFHSVLSSEDDWGDVDEDYDGEFLDYEGNVIEAFYNKSYREWEPVDRDDYLMGRMGAIEGYVASLRKSKFPEDLYLVDIGDS